MADLKPPRGAGDERATLHALLQFQRESFVRKVEGVDPEDARRSPLPSGTSLLWLTQHLAYAEQIWVITRFAADEVSPELVATGDSLPDAIAAYRATWAVVDDIVATAPDLEVRCRSDDAQDVHLRWVLTHLLEETARHAGHADILRELIDGSTGR